MIYTCVDREARAIALEEAAQHLDLNWTDEQIERAQGEVVSRQLRAEAEKWRDKAMVRKVMVTL